MLFSNSPVKNIVEKLNPFSQKNKISRLKFERKGDYKTFLKFIKDSTKEIEDIKIPESEDKKRKGLMIGGGLLGLGLLGFAARGKRDSDDGTGKLQSISGVIQKAKADSKKAISGTKTRSNLDTASDVIKLNRKRRVINKVYSDNIPKKVDVSKLNTDKIFDAVKNEKKTKLSKLEQEELKKKARRNNKSTTVTDVDGNTTKIKKSSTATIDNNQGKQGPTGGTRGRSGGNQPDLSEFERMVKRAEEIDKRIKQKINDPNFRVPDKIKKEVERINKQLSRTDLNPSTRKRLTDRLFNINKNIKEIQKQNKKFQSSKFFEAPEVPKNKTSKLNNFDKFNKFSNRILNSPVGKFTTFMGGLLASPKVEIIKQLFTATPLADGTLEGKPGVFNPAEQLIFNEDAAVNIFNFSEGRESMIPFSADVQLPSVTTPTEIQTGSNKIVVDYEFNTTEDLFFIKMAGS